MSRSTLLTALCLSLVACSTPEEGGSGGRRGGDEEEDRDRDRVEDEDPGSKAPAKRRGREEANQSIDEPATPARPAIDPTQEAAAQHILIRYTGARRAGPEVTRSKEEARTRAEEVLRKARAGANFDALVAEYSEEPRAAERKGSLGIFHPGRMVPEFDRAVFAMQVGDISDVVETAFGFHVIKRLPIERVAAQHILIMHKDSMRVPPGITRTKEEAHTRAEMVLKKARARGADFTALAREYTDEPQHEGRTPGDLGRFARGQMVPEFETAVFAMHVGDISDLVETPFGYHIIKRTE